jgi:hypothetical protein
MRTTLFCTLLLLSGSLFSQQNQFTFQLEADANASMLSGNSLISNVAAHGAHAGITLQHIFNEQWHLGTGLHYQYFTSRSGDITFTDQNGTDLGVSQMQGTIHYLQVPLLLEYAFQKASRLHLYAGVYGGLNLGDDYGIRDDLDVPVAEKEEGRYFNRHDAGLLAGVTYDICRGEQWTWAGQLRYQHGLMDVTQEFDNPDPFQNQVRSVGLGIVLKRSNTPQVGLP